MSGGTAESRLQVEFRSDSILAENLASGLMYADGTQREGLRSTVAFCEGSWLVWDGKVWASRHETDVIEIVRGELRELFLIETEKPDMTAQAAKSVAVYLQKAKAANVLYFLRGLLAVPADRFDSRLDLLNVQNGVIDLTTGELQRHNSLFGFTKIAGANYRPSARTDDWDSALQAVPEDVRTWMQERYGQAATGYMTSDDTLVIQQGGGSNGKSTLEDSIISALGDFATVIPEKALTGSSQDHPTDMMTLRGARLAVIEELPEGRHLPTKRLKDLVGTKRITARAMRQDFVTFTATHSLFVNSNYVPQVAETDHGTWRRLKLVKFPYRFVGPDERMLSIHDRPGDPGLRERLDRPENREAVLDWLVQGALRWFEQDRTFSDTPPSVVADTQEWREDADLILAYANGRLVFDPSGAVLSKELFEDFSDWLDGGKRAAWTDATFSSRFAAHELAEKNGVKKAKKRTGTLTVARRYAPNLVPPLPDQANIWTGVRFKVGDE